MVLASTRFETGDGPEYSGFADLLSIEDNLRAYNADIVSKIARYFEGKRSVLEFGAGIGTLAVEWEKQTGVKPECLEIDGKQQEIIAGRGFACYQSIDAVSGRKFDGVYTSNTLEHIDDDLGALKQVHSVMRDGGILAVYVPAFMCLFSEFDRSIGHYRRYDRDGLVDKAQRAGFQVIDCCYADCLGFFAWFAKLKLFGGATLTGLRFYDKWVYPLSNTLDALFMRQVLGKNLLLIARK
jgi:SAM-dependent methyltransferase